MKKAERWTIDDIIARFEEAATTMKYLPAVKVKGYISAWPEVVYSNFEKYQMEVKNKKPVVTLEKIERMEETCLWLRFLPRIEDRRLLWLRAERKRWKMICKKIGIKRAAANERWKNGLYLIMRTLNAR